MISGILEIVGNGAAFLRQREAAYLASKSDIFVGNKLIQRYGLRTADESNALAEEGERLLRFVAKSQGADEFEIRFGGEGT